MIVLWEWKMKLKIKIDCWISQAFRDNREDDTLDEIALIIKAKKFITERLREEVKDVRDSKKNKRVV